jgi:hypothetical protein
VLLAAKIIASDGSVQDCTIRDRSTQGAQIRVGPGQRLPNLFYLVEIKSGTAHRAEVAWRTGSLAGLRLSDRIDLDHPTAVVLAHLRQIWLDCAPK